MDHVQEYSLYKDETKESLAVIEDSLGKKADKTELEQLQALLQKQL